MARVIAGTSPERANRLMLAAAVVFAAIASLLVFLALQRQGDGGSGGAAQTTGVAVAARDIPANTKLTPDMLEVRPLPGDAVLDGAYEKIEPLVGLPTRFPLAKGEQLTPLKVGLEAIQDEDDLALVLPAGKRGVAVEVTEVTSVGGLLLPGNRVDVIAVFDAGTTGIDKAVTLLRDVEVLSVGQEAQQPVPAGVEASGETQAGDPIRGQRPDNVERQPGARTVTLAVSPEEAQLLALAQENGKLWLALRPLEDTEGLSPGEATLLPFLTP
ncbi:MAG: Flp pilus assembly protein CpaB [Chloroflexi bacterium RBG_16_68_14]|nr:MAG: Flp pilus assembly protein CpaB [Chloroflexi bacterium RBG_16_68_14]